MFLLNLFFIFFLSVVPVFSISSVDLDKAINKSLETLTQESRWAQNYYGKLLLEIGSVRASDASGIKRLQKKIHEEPKPIVSIGWKNYFVEEVLTYFDLAVSQGRRSSSVSSDDKLEEVVDHDSIIKKNQKLFSKDAAVLFEYLENPSEFESLDTCRALAFFIMLQEIYNLILVVKAHSDHLVLSEVHKAEVLRREQLAADWLEKHKDYSLNTIIF